MRRMTPRMNPRMNPRAVPTRGAPSQPVANMITDMRGAPSTNVLPGPSTLPPNVDARPIPLPAPSPVSGGMPPVPGKLGPMPAGPMAGGPTTPQPTGGMRPPSIDNFGAPAGGPMAPGLGGGMVPASMAAQSFGKAPGMKKGGKVKAKSASARADGIAQRGKTRGKIV